MSLAHGPSTTFCTFSALGDEFIQQPMYECQECDLTLASGLCVCAACAIQCHPARPSNGEGKDCVMVHRGVGILARTPHTTHLLGGIKGYCDCASTGACKLSVGGPEAIAAPPRPTEIAAWREANTAWLAAHEDDLDPRLVTPDYGNREYWDERFRDNDGDGTGDEWLLSFEDVREPLEGALAALWQCARREEKVREDADADADADADEDGSATTTMLGSSRMAACGSPPIGSGGDGAATAAVRPFPTVDTPPSLLCVGCGDSSFSADLYDQGFTNVCSTDVSEVVIERMKEAPDSLSRPSLRWCVDDACASSFADGAFDAVLDKGLIDCLMCESQEAVAKAVVEAGRVLRPGGRHIVLCFTNKDEVVRLMVEKAGLNIVSVEEVAVVGQGTAAGKGGEHGGGSTSDWEEVGEGEEGNGNEVVPLDVEGASEGEGASDVESARGARDAKETVGAGDVGGVLQQAAVAPVTAALEALLDAAESVDREVDAKAGDNGEKEADAADAADDGDGDDGDGDGDDGDGDGGGCWEMPVYMIVGTKPEP